MLQHWQVPLRLLQTTLCRAEYVHCRRNAHYCVLQSASTEAMPRTCGVFVNRQGSSRLSTFARACQEFNQPPQG